ncbi:MAG TPA: VC0807 family protein [Opitutaceae bacterium]
MTEVADSRPAPKQENLLLNLACNIALPAMILSRLSSEERLGPVGALVVGLAFPVGYGIYDLVVRRKWNIFSIVGVISVTLTGGLGLMKADGIWFALKEVAVPAMFAVAVLVTLPTRKPLVRALLFNESVIDVPKAEAALEAHGTRTQFNALLRSSTWILAGSFVLSAVLNFVLARLILKSPAGTPEFTAELGRMTWLSWPVIVLPSMAIMVFILWRLFSGIHRLTGMGMEDLMHKKPGSDRK